MDNAAGFKCHYFVLDIAMKNSCVCECNYILLFVIWVFLALQNLFFCGNASLSLSLSFSPSLLLHSFILIQKILCEKWRRVIRSWHRATELTKQHFFQELYSLALTLSFLPSYTTLDKGHKQENKQTIPPLYWINSFSCI